MKKTGSHHWFVQIERYDTGRVLAAIVRDKQLVKRPANIRKRQVGRIVTGQWVNSRYKAEALVAYAKGSEEAA